MKTYTATFAEDVPHYCVVVFEAENDADAIAQACATDFNTLFPEPDWSCSHCQRILELTGPDGETVANDIALDDCFIRYGGESDRRLCETAPDLLAALKAAHAGVLTLARERDPDQLGMWDAVFNEAKIAIANAEGEDAP